MIPIDLTELPQYAEGLAAQLAHRQRRVVFAESCTGGLAAATLSRIPGISEWLCGSAVTYREATKVSWLGVSADDLQQHTAVSEPVACQMAMGVLRNTPEADYSAAVTGHLGPDAPPELDGVIFIAVAARRPSDVQLLTVTCFHLKEATRTARQKEAAAILLQQLADHVSTGDETARP